MEVSSTLRVKSNLSNLPHGVQEVVRERISRLSLAGSELFAAGAVLGRRFSFESLLKVAGLKEAEGLRGLDELVERRLLIEDSSVWGELPLFSVVTYSFSHEKIRQVAYTQCGQARRWVLHRRAFETLEGSDVPPAELARHALAGGLAEPSFAYSLAAGDDAAEVFAVRDAIVHYERAREVLDSELRPVGVIEPSNSEVERLYTHLSYPRPGATRRIAPRRGRSYPSTSASSRLASQSPTECTTLLPLAGILALLGFVMPI